MVIRLDVSLRGWEGGWLRWKRVGFHEVGSSSGTARSEGMRMRWRGWRRGWREEFGWDRRVTVLAL